MTPTRLGDWHTVERTIGTALTVPEILPGSVLAHRGEPVLATGALIAMLEDATWEVLAPHIAPELAMLGRGGHYEHTAPTLPGQTVRIEVARTGGSEQCQAWTAIATNVDTGRQAGVLHHALATVDRNRFYRRLGK